MKAPDKIYVVQAKPDGTDFVGWAWSMKQNDFPCVEYIRKRSVIIPTTNEYIIRSHGFSDEIITAESEVDAVLKYKDKHPEREVTEVFLNEPL